MLYFFITDSLILSFSGLWGRGSCDGSTVALLCLIGASPKCGRETELQDRYKVSSDVGNVSSLPSWSYLSSSLASYTIQTICPIELADDIALGKGLPLNFLIRFLSRSTAASKASVLSLENTSSSKTLNVPSLIPNPITNSTRFDSDASICECFGNVQ